MSSPDNKQAAPPQPEPVRPARPGVEEIRRQLGWGLLGANGRQPAP